MLVSHTTEPLLWDYSLITMVSVELEYRKLKTTMLQSPGVSCRCEYESKQNRWSKGSSPLWSRRKLDSVQHRISLVNVDYV